MYLRRIMLLAILIGTPYFAIGLHTPKNVLNLMSLKIIIMMFSDDVQFVFFQEFNFYTFNYKEKQLFEFNIHCFLFLL